MGPAKRLRRLLKLVDLLQSGQVLNSGELAERCGVSRRTIFRDMAALTEGSLLIRYDEQRQGYYMPWRVAFSSDQLTMPEAASLLLVCQGAGAAETGIPFQELAVQAAEKVCGSLPPDLRKNLSQITESLTIRLDVRNPLASASSYYQIMLRALLEHRQVRIEYESASERILLKSLISPYRLLFSRRSWYLIGRSSAHRTVYTFNLGRIRHAEIVDSTFVVPPRFSLESYLGDAWHLIREKGQRHKVVVRFSRRVAQNVAEVHWHRNQSLTWYDDGSLDFTVSVEGLTEIRWWIMGYGDHAEVLEPAILRDTVCQMAQRMAQKNCPES